MKHYNNKNKKYYNKNNKCKPPLKFKKEMPCSRNNFSPAGNNKSPKCVTNSIKTKHHL